MNLSFQIQSENINTVAADLYLEISSMGLSYIILNNNVCVALVIYEFDGNTTDETAAGYIHQLIANQPVLQEKFNTIHIIYGYAPFILVPEEFMNETDAKAMLELVYGDVNERVIRTGSMAGSGMHNVYGIPAVIDMVITRYFEAAVYKHIFSILPAVINDPGNHLYCIFSRGQLKALLIKEGKLQAMQNFSYQVPVDVAYYLLNLCKSFEVNVNNTVVHLNGMIDANSALYNELLTYFLHVQFAMLPEQYQYPGEINQHPPHYFSHLFAVAACV